MWEGPHEREGGLTLARSRVKDKRLYECDECKERRYLHPVELMRAAKPRCFACGCTRLIVCSREAKKELIERNDRLVCFDDSRKDLARARRR